MGATWRARLAEAAVVLAAATVLAVVTTWPLALHLNSRAHDLFDPLYQAWQVDWMQHALGAGHGLWNANVFAPHVRTAAYGDSLLGFAVVLMPARWAGLSPIGVLNVALLLGYTTSAAAGYAFGRTVSGSKVVGVVTGVAFGFGPYNTFLGQHASIMFHPAVAIAATAAWCAADRYRRGRRAALWYFVIAAMVFVGGTVSFYVAAIAAVAATVVAVARAEDLGWRGLLQCIAGVVGGLVLLVPIALPYIQNSRDMPADFRWRLSDMRLTGADFFHVDPTLSLYGHQLASHSGTFGQPTFPGLVLLVLAIVGALSQPARLRLLSFALVATGVVLGIGASDTGWRRFAPYRLVYEFAPEGRALRATGRFWLVGLLGLGLLAGGGAERIIRVLAARRPTGRSSIAVVVATLCVLGVVVDGWRPWSHSPVVAIPAVDRALETLPPGGVLYLPVPTSRNAGLLLFSEAAVEYGTTAHHRSTPNGYASFYPASFFSLGAHVRGLPDATSVAFLHHLGVRYVVVPPAAGPWTSLRDPAVAAPLTVVGHYAGDILYELPSS